MKIAIKILDNTLYFSKYKKEISKDILNNTNIIDTKNLVFNLEYLKENKELIVAFLKVIIIKNNIREITIKQMDISDICINLINDIDSINRVTISENVKLSFDAFGELDNSKNIQYLSCNSIIPFMFDRLSIYKKIKIETRLETIYINNFMINNKLDKYSKIYYSKSFICDNPVDEDLEYISMVMSINNNLKTIKFKNFSFEVLVKILDICVSNNKNNLKVIIKIDNSNEYYIKQNIKKIKKLGKILKAKYNYKLRLSYSKEYINHNLLKQINLNIVKLSLLIIIIIMITIMTIYFINNIKTRNNIKDIKDIVDKNKIDNSNETNLNTHTPKLEEKDNTDYNANYYKKYNKVFKELLKINKETIGWLTVNNTTIDYPIVQHSDNDYYLNKDFYQNTNNNGWLFMDYRNHLDILDDNTIIYGHETDLKIMFGDLKKVLNKNWYTNKINQTISFNTLDNKLNFKIFSIYTINDTNDYLYNKFYNDEERSTFYNILKNRSIHNFNIDLNASDKILTLSTCYQNNKKLVVHAKLIK